MKSFLILSLQAGLAIAVLAPEREAHFTVPAALEDLGAAFGVLGLALAVMACFQLGPELTASPDPKPGGRVHARGFFRFVRHPIYSALLLATLGAALRSGNLVSVCAAASILAYFYLKAGYEERALARLYPEYQNYQSRTPRFVPALRRPSS